MASDLVEYYRQAIDTLNKIGISLSSQNDRKDMLKMILSGAMQITHADAGTFYLVHKNKLSFSIFANKSLNIPPSHILETSLNLISISLYIKEKPNKQNIASSCYHDKKTINIDDAYKNTTFDFSGTKSTDKALNYHTKSVLTIPLRNHEDNVIGVLQLINALDNNSNVVPFDQTRILFAESLASQAATILTKYELIRAQKKLFESLLHLIADAIDAKSRHTSNHCTRVPVITNMIANALNETSKGPFKHHHLNKDELNELMISAWLHDCGKIITPDHVINKSTKLETIADRIDMINDRFQILKRDVKISFLEKKLTESEFHAKIDELEQAQILINAANIGSEFIADADTKRIREIGETHHYFDGHEMKSLLTEDEINNLCISRGTLNQTERQIIQNHVSVTYNMLKSLPYPSNLKNVPEIAGSHHERVDGKGYPKGRKDNELSVQARILAIADIFEALTSPDRPYKTPKPLSEVLAIMKEMSESGHIDRDIFNLFVTSKVYLNFAKQFLNPEQIDC